MNAKGQIVFDSLFKALDGMTANAAELANALNDNGFERTAASVRIIGTQLGKMKQFATRASNVVGAKSRFLYHKSTDLSYDIRNLYGDLTAIDDALDVLSRLANDSGYQMMIGVCTTQADKIHDQIMLAEELYSKESTATKRVRQNHARKSTFQIGDHVIASNWGDTVIEGEIEDMKPMDRNDPDSEMTYLVRYGSSTEWLPETELEAA